LRNQIIQCIAYLFKFCLRIHYEMPEICVCAEICSKHHPGEGARCAEEKLRRCGAVQKEALVLRVDRRQRVNIDVYMCLARKGGVPLIPGFSIGYVCLCVFLQLYTRGTSALDSSSH
jgi:hypothetical protein